MATDPRPDSRPAWRRFARASGLALAAVLPGPVQRSLYRWCFGYRIGAGVRIGVAYLDCLSLSIDDEARIASGVAFLRCGDVTIGTQARVGPFNIFRGGTRVALGAYAQVLRQNVINAIPDHDCHGSPDSSFSLGYGSVVTSEHRIAFTDRVSIGRCSMLAGRNSSIWTHNRRQSRPVVIGDYCYLGSEIRVAPGVSVPDCCIVALGSVLMSPIADRGLLVAGSPARTIRALGPDDAETVFGKTRDDLPDEAYPTSVLSAERDA